MAIRSFLHCIAIWISVLVEATHGICSSFRDGAARRRVLKARSVRLTLYLKV